MAQRMIHHPLRDIVLKYDDSKPETTYEKDLLKAYIEMHDHTHAMQTQMNKLVYEYGSLNDHTAEAEKKFQPLAATLNGFAGEGEGITQENKDEESISDLQDRMSDYSDTVLSEFHQKTLNPLSEECESLQKGFNAFQQAEVKFTKDYRDYCNKDSELYKNYINFSLDLVSYDEDKEKFINFIFFDSVFDKQKEVIDRYNLLMDSIRASYAKWDNTQKHISEVYNDAGLLDSSLSDSYINGSGDPAKKPIYLIPPGHELITKFRTGMGMMANSGMHTLIFSVDMDVVKRGEVIRFQDIVMQLQHFPKMIEKWIFAIKIEFLNELQQPMSEDDWKGHKVPMAWLHKFSALPCSIFFIQDHDARAYILMGDLELPVDEKTGGVILQGDILQEVCARLFNACWFFMLYCHNTGFDPEPYIEALLADYSLPVTYEQIKEQYEKDVKSGIQLRTVTKNGE